MVKLPAANGVVALATTPEAQELVLARLLTTTVWFPDALPEAAVALTMLELEELTVRADRGPIREFIACMSLSRFVASV